MINSGVLRCLKHGVCILALGMTAACAIVSVKHTDGAVLWTLRIRVEDPATARPVSDADVRIIVQNEDSFGDFESFVKEKETPRCTTNSDGVCEIATRFNYYGTEWLWRKHEYINFRHRNVVVQAKGYQPLSEPLKKFVRTPYELTPKEQRAISEFAVELVREQESGR